MTPEEFRASRRETVELPNGMKFEIHRISAVDLLRMGSSPDLRPLIGKEKQEVLKAIGKHAKDLWESVLRDLAKDRGFLEKVVMEGVVSPRIVRESDAPETVYVGDLLHEELDMLAGKILNFSFLTKKEAQKIDPLSETEDSSSTLTPSGGDTENSQAKSSQSPGNGSPQPTPLTSHVPAQESQKKPPPASA
jgi:hypothetical protein